MLEPKETDIPALFLVLIVLPLVAYFLLGKWSETTKKKKKVCVIAQRAAEETQNVEDMTVGSVIRLVHLPNNRIHLCARCSGPATTRCSQCKSVRYCSGKCQILHWRQVHKFDCQQFGINFQSSWPNLVANDSYYETTDPNLYGCCVEHPNAVKASLDDAISPHSTSLTTAIDSGMITNKARKLVINQSSIDADTFLRRSRDSSRTGYGAVLEPSVEASTIGVTHPSLSCSSKGTYMREGDFLLPEHLSNIPYKLKNGDGEINNHILPESDIDDRTSPHAYDSGYDLNSLTTAKSGSNSCDDQMDLIKGEYLSQKGITSRDESKDSNCSSERTSTKRSNKGGTPHSHGLKLNKSPKSGVKMSKEPLSLENIKGQTADESRVAIIEDNTSLQECNRVAENVAIMTGLTNARKLDHQQHPEDIMKRPKKVKVLFPYEEFVKCFQFEVFNVSPRGLVNCGNSCYANAVLQCLMCTKPLITYLSSQSHSRAGCAKDWCLMCELEQHAMMLRKTRSPLTPINILMHIRSLNSQIGYGSQEDAHEFLRLLVTSMQSIYLEDFGEENLIDRLQDTTFIHYTFGGCLRSKVKCLRCHHESERHENMMDLTLEIFGQVKSLEDALTQFTSSEDLDGENMYRCGRCAEYVQAWKQLRIIEAPNILTIVLKRFQEGNYGKPSKCITFPEMLDLIPFMTGTDDIPPLYMLYAVVVHLDAWNASLSGHYISYVKDLKGNWFKVDDTEVYPVKLSQVMSEEAYILFYMRSNPRPARSGTRKAIQQQRSSRPEESKLKYNLARREPSLDHRLEMKVNCPNVPRRTLITENQKPPVFKKYTNFSDATSSDWSLFTSSDDSSFTTESARDSFSTVDYKDIPQPFYLSSKPQTRFGNEEKGFDSVLCLQKPGLCNNISHVVHVNRDSEPREGPPQTCICCI